MTEAGQGRRRGVVNPRGSPGNPVKEGGAEQLIEGESRQGVEVLAGTRHEPAGVELDDEGPGGLPGAVWAILKGAHPASFSHTGVDCRLRAAQPSHRRRNAFEEARPPFVWSIPVIPLTSRSPQREGLFP